MRGFSKDKPCKILGEGVFWEWEENEGQRFGGEEGGSSFSVTSSIPLDCSSPLSASTSHWCNLVSLFGSLAGWSSRWMNVDDPFYD